MEYDEVFKALPQEEGSFGKSFAFSIHKCGSSMMHAMISAVCKASDVPSVTIPDMMFNLGHLEIGWQSDPQMLPAFQKDLLYYGFRNLPPVLETPDFNLKDHRFALLVRDPRDALVSMFFSLGRKKGSHAVPKNNPEQFIKKMASNEDLEIDEYVIRAAHGLKAKFEAYRGALNFDLGLLRRYEDVYFDKETFLREIFEHYGIEIAPQVITRVAAKYDIRPTEEDDTKHIRKGTPGDHKEKLKPETIAQLNDFFRETGAFYGYQL